MFLVRFRFNDRFQLLTLKRCSQKLLLNDSVDLILLFLSQLVGKSRIVSTHKRSEEKFIRLDGSRRRRPRKQKTRETLNEFEVLEGVADQDGRFQLLKQK